VNAEIRSEPCVAGATAGAMEVVGPGVIELRCIPQEGEP
jgi:hypothetical protein